MEIPRCATRKCSSAITLGRQGGVARTTAPKLRWEQVLPFSHGRAKQAVTTVAFWRDLWRSLPPLKFRSKDHPRTAMAPIARRPFAPARGAGGFVHTHQALVPTVTEPHTNHGNHTPSSRVNNVVDPTFEDS